MVELEKKPGSPDSISGSGCLVRLGWMLLGNAVLILCAALISRHQGAFLSAADAVFWATVPVLLWLRRVDITRLHGQTAYGTPASLSHWRRYVGLLLAFSLVLWSAAHAVAWLRH